MSDFDKHIQQQAGNYGKQPREHVWQRISHELDGKKRRRVAFWLWWLLPLALAGGSAWWISNSHQPSTDKVAHQAIQHNPEVPPIKQAPQEEKEQKKVDKPIPNKSATATTKLPPKTMPANEGAPPKTILTKIPTKKTGNGHINEYTLQQKANGQTDKSANTETTDRMAYTPTPTPSTQSIVAATNNQYIDSAAVNQYQPGVNLATMAAAESNEQLVSNNDSYRRKAGISISYATPTSKNLLQAPLQVPTLNTTLLLPATYIDEYARQTQDANNPKPASNTLAIANSNQPKLDRRWNLLAGVGMHNISGNQLGLRATVADFNSFTPGNLSGGQGSTPMILQPPKPGIGFMLGLERIQPIGQSPRWNWLAGVHYQYQSIKITSGARRDSALRLENTFNDQRKSASYFLLPGNTQTQTGHQHRVMLQAGLQWKVLANGKWIVQGSTFAGLTIRHNYWLPQTSNLGWVPTEGLVSRGFSGLETGLSYRPAGWGLGVYGQYTFTPASTFSSLPKQYWRGIELRFQHALFQKTSK